MNPAFRLTSCAIAAALLTFSVGSHALTLGRARGAAIVAQPLSVSIAVSANADEDVSDVCFEADVFYGESRVDGSRVTVSADTATAGQTWSVRISSRLPVDEPVVTVYLRSTCSAKASRRYVLLADVATDSVSATPVLPSVLASPVTSVPATGKPVVDAGAKNAASVVGGPANTRAPDAKRKRERELAEKPMSVAPRIAPVNKSGASSKSRLKLAPLDLSVERDPALQSTPELLSTPTEDNQKRGEAIALWRALNLTPEDVMRDAARLQGLEATVRELSSISKSNQQQMQALKGALEQSDRERYSNPVVWGLGGAILLLLAGGVWLLRRQQSGSTGSSWWQPDVESVLSPGMADAVHADAPDIDLSIATVPPASSSGGVMATLVQQPLADVDIDLHLEPVSAVGAAVSQTKQVRNTPVSANLARPSRTMELREFSHSMSGSLRSMNTQEMLDIRQQAEFFVTLGQYDDALSLLQGHIADATEANPLVYLDLLKILHTLSRKDEFDSYRAEFNAIFTGQVAEYKDFSKPSEGLEVYPELCAHLSKLWPSREALHFIESCLVRNANAAATMLFELEAFKELLLLHGVATRLVEALDGGAPVSFSASRPVAPMAPVFHTGPSPLDVSLPVSASAPAEVDFELDISLDLPETPVPAPVDNLIDFDPSGLTFSANKDKHPG